MNTPRAYQDAIRDLEAFYDIASEHLRQEYAQPVSKYREPQEWLEGLDITLGDHGMKHDDMIGALREIIAATPKTSTTRFFNQLFGGRQSKAMLGDLIAVLLNSSMYTYKAGGPQILIEQEILSQVRNLLGWDENSSGTLAAGGSMTNLMGMQMARDRAQPAARTTGLSGKVIAYTSAECHYSIQKNAAILGIGREQVRLIPTDQTGGLRPDLLKQSIERDLRDGHRPFMVNATAGTTVLGAFDPIEQIAEICEKYDLWLHVDGAYCGSVIFSEKYKHLIQGVERADSFTLNAHKMLGTPLSCSLILVQEKRHMYHSYSTDASYLFQTHEDELNPGKISLQCGRRNDALKLWCLWKSIGTAGLGSLVNHQFHLADVAREYIRTHEDYQLYSHDDSVGICFNYLDIPAEKLCNGLYQASEMMVGYGQFRDDVFIRLVTINASNTEEDIHEFFRVLEAFAQKHVLHSAI